MGEEVQRFHIDRRAHRVVADLPTDAEDRLLSTDQVAELLSCSRQWLEMRRIKGGGPTFVRVSPRRVRYRLSDLREWLESRTHQRTSEYAER